MTNQRIIYSTSEGGVAVVIPTGELPIEEVAAKDIPEGVAYEIVEDNAIPADRFFRSAWVLGDCCIDHDLDKCKEIGHDIRRSQRAEEFKPFDEVIMKQIPGTDATVAEEARQAIRDKYADMQIAIDTTTSPEQIKVVLNM
jgi:hypothetical protein